MQLTDAAKQAAEDQGRISGLGIQLKVLQEAVVGEELLRRELGERVAEILGLRRQIAILQHSQIELSKLQGEHAELQAEAEMLRKAQILSSTLHSGFI
jgi:hypothetical protein